MIKSCCRIFSIIYTYYSIVDNKVIKVNLVDAQSSFLKKEKISYNKIRVLAINTDYVDALEWYSKHKE